MLLAGGPGVTGSRPRPAFPPREPGTGRDAYRSRGAADGQGILFTGAGYVWGYPGSGQGGGGRGRVAPVPAAWQGGGGSVTGDGEGGNSVTGPGGAGSSRPPAEQPHPPPRGPAGGDGAHSLAGVLRTGAGHGQRRGRQRHHPGPEKHVSPRGGTGPRGPRYREPAGIFAELRLLPLRRLDRFEKTNEMLLNFNNLSSVRMQQMNERFLHHTKTLVEMKKDLDSIFRRIRWATGMGTGMGMPLLVGRERAWRTQGGSLRSRWAAGVLKQDTSGSSGRS